MNAQARIRRLRRRVARGEALTPRQRAYLQSLLLLERAARALRRLRP